MKHYMVNEVFYSVQGEGVRAGTANVFVRFSGCNLTCRRDNEAGFDCDTEFVSGRKHTAAELVAAMNATRDDVAGPKACVLTGGEPLLQVDDALIDALVADRWYIAVETNGTVEPPAGIDWLCVSPKSAEHTLKVKRAQEVKYVRHRGQGIPRPVIEADHYLLSPAFVNAGEVDGWALSRPDIGALEWCILLVKENTDWRLSVQQHKAWRVR